MTGVIVMQDVLDAISTGAISSASAIQSGSTGDILTFALGLVILVALFMVVLGVIAYVRRG